MPDDLTFPHADATVRWVTHDPRAEPDRRALLAADEHARLAAFASAARRRSFVLGRAAARTLLGERLGVAPSDVPLCVEPSGAPFVAAPGVHVSISHAGAHAVAAVGPRRLGVDVEVIAPRHPDLARRLLHPHERAEWESLALDDVRRVLLLWTVKEATLKALGTGLRRSPSTLRAAFDLAGGAARVTPDDGAPWRVRFTERAGCYLALALPDEGA